ncbi:MAG: tetratricopeptide repeat protein [Nocardiopsaceae bacterium]|nr:tetratricopeptide repeat protein [Nocardiopsaceae bacterium]
MDSSPGTTVSAGTVPPLVADYVPRPQVEQLIAAELKPGTTVTLVSSGARAELAASRTSGEDSWRDPSGKTQLAVATAQRLRGSGGVEVLVWVSATNVAAVQSVYAEAAAAIEGQASGNAEAAAERFASWLRETSRPWLVVLDNLTAPTVPARLWPQGPAGRVLITAPASAAVPFDPAGPTIIPVGPFSRRESLSYLRDHLKEDAEQRQGATDLVAALGDEPLPISQASVVIANSDMNCHDYLDLIVGAGGDTTGEGASVAAATWALSVQHADMLSSGDAQRLLVRAALLDGTGIPAGVFGAPRPPALDALAQAALITIDETSRPPIVRINRVTQAAVRYAMPDGMLAQAASAAASALVESWPLSDKPEWLSRCLRSCAISLRARAGDLLWDDKGCHDLLLRAGQSLDAARLTSSAVGYWEDLVAVSERRLGLGHRTALAIRERLARAHLRAGQARESLAWFERIRTDRSRSLGAHHVKTAEACHDLGRALVAVGRPGDAVEALADATAGYERARGKESLEALTARDDLAAAQRTAGQLRESVATCRRTLADRERLQGKRHPDTMATRRQLADSYLSSGQPRAAISLYKKLLADSEKTLGAVHPDTVSVRESLAAVQYAAGKLSSAIDGYEWVYEQRARTLGDDHEQTLRTCVHLAHAYHAAGRVTDAASLLRETVRRCQLTRPAADPLTRTARDTLATIRG